MGARAVLKFILLGVIQKIFLIRTNVFNNNREDLASVLFSFDLLRV